MSDELSYHVIPAFTDNYFFALRNEAADETVVVDPGSSREIIDFLEDKNWGLNFIWNTHHHPDHIGGNLELKKTYGCKIIANHSDAHRIPGADILVKNEETFDWTGHTVLARKVPGHTLGHIAYQLPQSDWLFCGDTLFSLGCGRLFEGTAKQLWTSLKWIRSLSPDTLIFCAHEYTLANSQFALSVDGENSKLIERAHLVEEMRSKGISTVPTLLADEIETNPFLRADKLKQDGQTEEECFAHLRKLKDDF